MAKTHHSQCLNSHDVRSARSLGSKARLRVRAALQMSANTPHSLPISLRAPASLSAWCSSGVLSGAILVSCLVPAWFLSGSLLVPVWCLPGATTGAPSGAPPGAPLVPRLVPDWCPPCALFWCLTGACLVVRLVPAWHPPGVLSGAHLVPCVVPAKCLSGACLVPAWFYVWCLPGALPGACLVPALCPVWYLPGARLVHSSGARLVPDWCPPCAPSGASLVPALCHVWCPPGAPPVPVLCPALTWLVRNGTTSNLPCQSLVRPEGAGDPNNSNRVARAM